MKTKRASLKRGGALLACVIVLTASLLIGMGALVKWSLSSYKTAVNRTMRSRMLYTAESGCQYALAYLCMNVNAFSDKPSTVDFQICSQQFRAVAANTLGSDMILERYYIDIVNSNWYQTNGFAAQDSEFPGMRCTVSKITVKSGIRWTNTLSTAQASDTNLYVEVDQIIEARSFSLLNYGVFMDGPMYLVNNKEMIISGNMHCNGIMTLGGPAHGNGQGLYIAGYLTCASDIYCIANADMVFLTNVGTAAAAGGMRSMDWYGMTLDCSNSNWRELSDQVWNGGVMSAAHGVKPIPPPIPYIGSNTHQLIDIPDAGDSAGLAQAKYANRAGVRVLTNGYVECCVSSIGTSNIYGYAGKIGDAGISTGATAWLTTNAYFWNAVISNWVKPWDIDVGNFKVWAAGAAGYGFFSNQTTAGILYVALPTNRPGHAVRLKNGSIVPNPVFSGGVSNGFTVVTHNPLYIWGDYNIEKSFHVDSDANAVCAGDSITVLSSGWTDGHTVSMTSPNAAGTKYWTGMLTGYCTNRYTGDANAHVGCIDSLPRYIEDWQGAGIFNKEIRGTVAAIWGSLYDNAVMAIDITKSPKRLWKFDPRFGYAAGTPRFYEFVPTEWKRVAKR